VVQQKRAQRLAQPQNRAPPGTATGLPRSDSLTWREGALVQAGGRKGGRRAGMQPYWH
jgi:hypothetical protein